MPVHLTTRAEIDSLLRRSRLFDRPEATQFLLPSELADHERTRLSRRLGFYLSDCGCGPASFAMIGTLGLQCWVLGAAPWALGWSQIAQVLGVALFIGFTVKTAALAVSLTLLRRELTYLKTLFET